MAHNIMRIGNRYSVMSVRERPWHGLGQVVQTPLTAEEAITEAGLDWIVEKVPVQYNAGGLMSTFRGRCVTMNQANGCGLGIVGATYQVIQNRTAFGFFDTVVGEGKAVYHTAGALGNGERVWILAKLPKDLILPGRRGDEAIERFLLLMNSHDGSLALRMFFTPIRVVCQNTLSAAMRGWKASEGISIRHNGDIKSKVQAAKDALGIATNYYERMEEVAKRMVDAVFSKADTEAFTSTILPQDSMEENAMAEARY